MIAPLRRHRRLIASTLVTLMAFWQIGQPLQAATLVWDSNTGTAGAQDGAGSWTAGGLVFWNGTANVATTNDVTTDIAQFGNGGAGGIVNVSTQSINGLIFGASTAGYTLQGGAATQVLTIGAGGVTMDS
jgi:hypothetical protein